MSLLQRYVSDPKQDGSYVLHLDEKETRELWDEVDAMAEELKALKSQGKAVCEALEAVINTACHPDVAMRSVMVPLDPVRKALTEARVVFPK